MDDAFKVNKERMYLSQFLVAPRSKNKGRLGTSGKNLCKNQKVRCCDTLSNMGNAHAIRAVREAAKEPKPEVKFAILASYLGTK